MWREYMQMLDDAWAVGDLDYPSYKILADAARKLYEHASRS